MFVLIVAGITRGVPVRFQRCTEVLGCLVQKQLLSLQTSCQVCSVSVFIVFMSNSQICHTVPRSRTQSVRLTPCLAATLDFDKLLLICKVQNMVGVRHEKRNQ